MSDVNTYTMPWFERGGEEWWPMDAEVEGRDHTGSWFRGEWLLKSGCF